MSDKTKELIGELKAIRLELFRSAAGLDGFITQLDNDLDKLDGRAGPDYVKTKVRWLQVHREDEMRIREYDKLIAKEKEIWQKIVDSL